MNAIDDDCNRSLTERVVLSHFVKQAMMCHGRLARIR